MQVAQQGKKVLLIDFDAQCNTSGWFGIKVKPGDKSISDVIRGEANFKEASVAIEGVPGLYVCPATRLGLDAVMVELTRATDGVFLFHDRLRASDLEVDHVIIDCPGSYSTLVVAALLATEADEDDEDAVSGVITCTQPMLKENQGIVALLDELKRIAKTYRRDIELLAIVPCIVPLSERQGYVYAEQLESVQQAFPLITTPPIRRSAAVPTAFTHQKAIPLFGKAKPVNEDYAKALAHLQERQCLA
ncbi:cellulose biosynthesis protein BcsQ [Amycolatopsis roodepoortensis]|uniref:Cellulose biosynthesis protein BcsQ n=1 Tax=Amycolatopsis roodepoortensis TaxID=700274 RepID=A0ABR9LIM6_9PSEU|nr:cellulose biosynthesis protein BcsQ [Amycolatopsis roodepoortensis]